MTRRKTSYKSEALAAAHEIASDLYNVGILDKKTMREFDESCLKPVEKLTPKQIRQIRDSQQVSQEVFARYLNVSSNSVSQWERGDKVPAGPSLKLLNMVKRKGLAILV